MAVTKWHQAQGFIEYAQVFEVNRDRKSPDARVQKLLDKVDGRYTFRFYPKDEEVLQYMKSHLSDPMFGGNPRFKESGKDYGVGVYTTFKRNHKDPSGIEDFGGPIEVVHWGATNKEKGTPWDVEEDGFLGNGTEVIIKYTTYGTGESQTVRPVKIGVINLVPYNIEQEGF